MGKKVLRLFIDVFFLGVLAVGLTYGSLMILKDGRIITYTTVPSTAIRDAPFIVACVLLAIAGVATISTVMSFILFFRKAGWSWIVLNLVLIFIVICLTIYVALHYNGVDINF